MVERIGYNYAVVDITVKKCEAILSIIVWVTNLLCCYYILSWRIFRLILLSREMLTSPIELAFSDTGL
ncbi:hypothetical protein EU962_07780 [Salmonella enterica subsp. enterica serovar Nottingham]|nr:hypothetical protein [Salmonella enterica subsp. enterica serovar Nottingham]